MDSAYLEKRLQKLDDAEEADTQKGKGDDQQNGSHTFITKSASFMLVNSPK